MDGEDFEEGDVFKKSEVKIYHHNFGEVIVEKLLFKKMLFDYSKSLINIYKNSSELSNTWIKEMKHSINILSKNINTNLSKSKKSYDIVRQKIEQ